MRTANSIFSGPLTAAALPKPSLCHDATTLFYVSGDPKTSGAYLAHTERKASHFRKKKKKKR